MLLFSIARLPWVNKNFVLNLDNLFCKTSRLRQDKLMCALKTAIFKLKTVIKK